MTFPPNNHYNFSLYFCSNFYLHISPSFKKKIQLSKNISHDISALKPSLIPLVGFKLFILLTDLGHCSFTLFITLFPLIDGLISFLEYNISLKVQIQFFNFKNFSCIISLKMFFYLICYVAYFRETIIFKLDHICTPYLLLNCFNHFNFFLYEFTMSISSICSKVSL